MDDGFVMLVARTSSEVSAIISGWKSEKFSVSFVPTMGALHDGHISLVTIAKKNADRVVASIFVNPTQFAPHEDFAAYPRDEKGDLAKLEDAGVDLVYIPTVGEMYPEGAISDIKAGPAAQGLESDFRPHFFDGVCSIVLRLFDHVKPDCAVFGEKDYQQLMVIEEMVREKNLPIKIIPAPIMRDQEGLALSSRNAYLSAEELRIAQQLNRILFETAEKLKLLGVIPDASRDWPHKGPSETCDPGSGKDERDPGSLAFPRRIAAQSGKTGVRDDTLLEILGNARQKLIAAGFDEVQYLETRWNRLLATVKIGTTRLIDNVEIRP